MQRIYFYPRFAVSTIFTNNPYTTNFVQALSNHFKILNADDQTKVGIFNIFKYILKTDYLFLNWIEELPDKKGGYIQSIIFICVVYFLKLKNKKLCWIIHNKLSHWKKNLFLKKVLFRFLLKKSDIIITHAKEGINYAKSLSKKKNLNIFFFPHPVNPMIITNNNKKNYDILIWGSINPYKGIDKFLNFLYQKNIQAKYKIKIAGKIFDSKYRELLFSYRNDNISIENKFVENEELENLIKSSKFVLFTYNNESVLSSGALTYSLAYGARIIGPNTGAFKDMAEEDLVRVFDSFEDLIKILDNQLMSVDAIQNERLLEYVQKNSWDNFTVYIYKLITT